MKRMFYVNSAHASSAEGVTVYLHDLNDEYFEVEVYVTIDELLRMLSEQNSDYTDLLGKPTSNSPTTSDPTTPPNPSTLTQSADAS